MQRHTEKYSKLTNKEYVTFKGLQLTQPQKQNPDNGKKKYLEVITANLEFFTMEGYNSKIKVCFSPSYEKIHQKSNLRKALILVHDLRRFISSLQGGK